jgi:hypothetical protein
VPQSGVSAADKYAYNTLTADEKKLYDAILNGTETLMWRLREYDDMSFTGWTKILGMVFHQEAQLFWMDSEARVGKVRLIESDPQMIASMQKEIDAVVNPLLNEAKGKSSTFDKLKVFHDWLVLNCSFAWDEPHHATIYGAFVLKKAQCAGYAKGMKYLCDKAGIKSMVVTGYNNKGESHAWNVVDVNGVWYNLDSMWDDPVFSTPMTTFLRNTYFLVPDRWIHNNTHFDVNTRKLNSGTITYFKPPACTETAQNYFTVKNMVYKDAASADKAIKEQIDKAVAAKGHVVEIRADSKEVYDAIYNKLREYQTYALGKSTTVKGLTDTCNATMLSIQLNIFYN